MSQHDWLAGAVGDVEEVEEEPWAAGSSPAVISRSGCRPQCCRRGSRMADLPYYKEWGLVSVFNSHHTLVMKNLDSAETVK